MTMEAFKQSIRSRAIYYHTRASSLRKLPLPALLIIGGLVMMNVVAWVGVGIVLVIHDYLLSLSSLTSLSALPRVCSSIEHCHFAYPSKLTSFM